MGKPYVKCPHCESNLDHGERCDCQRIEIQPEKIRDADINAPARAVLAAVKKAFDDPAVVEDYQRWLAERHNGRVKGGAVCTL